MGDTHAAADPGSLRDASRKVAQHKLYNNAMRVSTLVAEIVSRVRIKSSWPSLNPVIEDLTKLIGEITVLAKDDGRQSLADLAGSMDKTIENNALSPSTSERIYELLMLHAQAIAATLREDEGASELVVSALNVAAGLVGNSA